MKLITLNKDNIEKEHICCSMANNTSMAGVTAKKEWLKCRFEEGLKFVKADARGKVFIEYLPAENAWVPIDAKGYTHINCFWVSGSFKGKGLGKQLLEECEADAKKNSKGITAIVGNKKKGFLMDKSFLIKYGFEVCDTAPPYFELLVKRFDKKAKLPKFRTSVKEGLPEGTKGIDIFYTPQCPFTIPYIALLEPAIKKSPIPVRTHQIKTKEEAQNHICPFTTYNVFVNGKFENQEIMTPAKLEKIINLARNS